MCADHMQFADLAAEWKEPLLLRIRLRTVGSVLYAYIPPTAPYETDTPL